LPANFRNYCGQEFFTIESTLARDTTFRFAMSLQALRETRVRTQDNVGDDGALQADIPALNSLAVRSLTTLFDEKEQLFSERATLHMNAFRRCKASRRHTIVALLGLHRLAESGGAQPFDIEAIQNVVFRDRSWVKTAGHLGLLTWFTAVCLPERLGTIFEEFDFERVLERYKDARQARTAGLAWFLAGIAHARLARPEAIPDLTDVAADSYRLLEENQSQDGIFGHAASVRFPRETLNSRFGTFSDQIFAIYALSMFSRAFQIEDPLESALACANSICALQGQLGQWWFLYDKCTGRVVSRYPVLSVHQDGTAPCGLLALEEATGRSFQKAISKGLSWIAGANELRNDLGNIDQAFIWDSIGPAGRMAKYLEAGLGFLMPSRQPDVDRLRIQYDARPDHFGWLLYAFGKFGLPTV
jgi:hypothetical protein